MIDYNVQCVRPTVIISHNAQPILKRTMRMIYRHGILRNYGFGLKGCPSCDLQLLYEQARAQITPPTFSQGLPISLCGADISVGDPVRRATLGGVFILDETYYGITVAHAFTEKASTSYQEQNASSRCTLCDEDWAEDSSEDSSEDNASEGNVNRLTDVLPTSLALHGGDEDQTLVEASVSSDKPELVTFEVLISSQDPLRGRDGLPFDDLDWAVSEIVDCKYHGMNRFLLDEQNQEWLYVRALRYSPPQGRIIIATRRGVVKGLGTGSTTSIKLSESGCFRHVWSIQPDEALGMCSHIFLQDIMSE